MKAIQLQAPSSLETMQFVDLPDPGPPAAGEIQVRIRASSLNYHDLIVALGATAPTHAGRIPMSDGAGDVTAVGEGVAEFKVGDAVVSTFFPDWLDGGPLDAGFTRVPGDGIDGYARELVNAPAAWFTGQPRGYSHAEAATLTCAGVTAWRALVVDGALKAGDVVLTQGTGGVSIFALQIAKAMGATVIATSSSDEKLERLKALGADLLINYRKEPKWGRAARAQTGGRGVDHVVEVAGSLAESMAACRAGGHIATIGVLSGMPDAGGSFAPIGKQLRIQGLIVGSRRHQQEFVRAIDATGLKPVIDRAYPLEKLADAFRRQQAGEHFGKIVVEI